MRSDGRPTNDLTQLLDAVDAAFGDADGAAAWAMFGSGNTMNGAMMADAVDRLRLLVHDLRRRIDNRDGLTLTFDTRLQRFDATAFDALIAEVLGPDTDVTIEERSNLDAEGPAFIRINGARPEDLVAVAEAFYDRAWRGTEAVVEERALQKAMSSGVGLLLGRLDEMRDHLVKVEASTNLFADEEVRGAITEKAAEHAALRLRPSLQTRFQRVADGVYEDAKKFSKVSGTIDAVVSIGREAVADVRTALGAAASRRFSRQLTDAGLDPVPDPERED